VTDVVLIHGAGGSSACWSGFDLPGFTSHTIDLHSPWTWDSMLDQIEELGLDNPAVVGQSMGGSLAVRWGKRHPECPAIVNLDGNGYPSTYPGLSDVDRWRRELDAVFDKMAETMDPDLLPIRELVSTTTVKELYDGLACPALIVVATKIMEVQQPFAEYYEANHKGILADLEGRETVLEFDASHNMLSERKQDLAAIVTRFLTDRAG
jgi:pimeloyl-ACP methyl ester carboxylesterase